MTAPLGKPETRCVLLAAGGTGGHMFPAQALARELLGRGIAVALLTDKRGGGFGPDMPQVKTFRISAGTPSGPLPRRVKGLFLLGVGFFQASRVLKELAPSAVVGFGGYPSVPTIIAAARQKRRIVLHEQNQVVGRANRLLAGRAEVIATSFDPIEGLSETDRAKTVLTGNPVRPAIADVGRQPYAVPGPGDRLRLLVTGGSQGARVFNELLPAAICQLPEDQRRRLSISQQVRGSDLEEIQARYRGCGVKADLAPFFDDMPKRLKAAQLMICRSGASTIAELAAAGRPAILVPFPFAADDHQTGNARAFAQAGGGWLMPQGPLTPESLAERLTSVLSQPALLARAASSARAFAQDNAAKRLADLVCCVMPANGESGRNEEKAA
jgi:UDP-N-acetylglucosamine--N-acetylmuramyl-(pentapeptide) pyrophosphoryl-undecaprenol N-acetylglucosamine transferase